MIAWPKLQTTMEIQSSGVDFIVIHCGNFVTDAVPKCSFQEPSGELCPTDATKSIRLSACAMASAWQGERDPEWFSPIEIISQSYTTPLKTNVSPENQWLEDVFPTEIVPFWGTR